MRQAFILGLLVLAVLGCSSHTDTGSNEPPTVAAQDTPAGTGSAALISGDINGFWTDGQEMDWTFDKSGGFIEEGRREGVHILITGTYQIDSGNIMLTIDKEDTDGKDADKVKELRDQLAKHAEIKKPYVGAMDWKNKNEVVLSMEKAGTGVNEDPTTVDLRRGDKPNKEKVQEN